MRTIKEMNRDEGKKKKMIFNGINLCDVCSIYLALSFSASEVSTKTSSSGVDVPCVRWEHQL